ncbi:MAG: acetolactate synthase small subunit [Desulfobacterales bacterium]|jgi:acetolactate synthase-1/3 small subunit|nr:acetolactate synthase small subunit [Desulfobacterales bacterium]
MPKILSLLVRNHPGVLSHIAGLFTRRGYNIESIAAGETATPNTTRITIVVGEDESMIERVSKQIRKLIDVIKVQELTYEGSITRELLLLTLLVPVNKRSEVITITNTFGATVVDISDKTMTIEISGNSLKINTTIRALGEYKIKELARTGMVALPLESMLDHPKKNTRD